MISRTSEYAIRSLSFMASRPRGEFHLALDMARELGIPAAFLGKVLQPLVVRGLLSSQRGRGGGGRHPVQSVRQGVAGAGSGERGQGGAQGRGGGGGGRGGSRRHVGGRRRCDARGDRPSFVAFTAQPE